MQMDSSSMDSLRIESGDEQMQIRVESARSTAPYAAQTFQWSGWQWLQPLGSSISSYEEQPLTPRLLFGVRDSLFTLPYLPLQEPVRWESDEYEEDWMIMGNPYSRPVLMNSIRGVGGEIQSSVGYVWDREKMQFRPTTGREPIYPGDVILLKNLGAQSVEIPIPDERNQSSGSTRFEPDRWVRFSLINRVSSRKSEVALHFEQDAEPGLDPLDLESIYSGMDHIEFPDSPKLFIQGVYADSVHWMSRDARPFDLESPMDLSLGFLSQTDSGPHRLEWEITENIPDDWTLELTDLRTRQQIDLRQRQSYRFDGDGAVLSAENLELEEIRSLLLDEPYQRFQVRIAPRVANSGGPVLSQIHQDPDKMELHANYPNPFSVETSIEFFLPEETVVYLNIYNVVGQRVAQLMNGEPIQGWHSETWSAGDLPSGIYILRLETPRGVLTRKMTLIR